MEGKDLTQGNLLKNMIKFCIPLLITNLLNSMYNFIDGIWIGRLIGDEGIAFVLIPLCQMLIGFVLGTGNTRFVFIALFISSISEIIILFAIQYNYHAPFVALGVSILMWYIVNIILCTCYYFSNRWKRKDLYIIKSDS